MNTWKGLPQYRGCVALLERRGQPISFKSAHALAMRISDTLLQVRRECQVEKPDLLLRAAYEFLAPARSFLKDRALSLEELHRLGMKSSVWQQWARDKSNTEASKRPARLARQLTFIEDIGIERVFDLVDLIESVVPPGGPRRFGIAFTPEQNLDLLRKLASGVSLREMAASLGGGNAPGPTFGAVRDRRDDLWKHIAAELDGLMPRKAAPKRQYAKNPKRGQQFWTKQGVDDADLHDGESSKPDRPCGAKSFASLRRVKQNAHTALQKIWSYS